MNEFSFPGKKDNEQVVLIVRQHPWSFFTVGTEIVVILAVYLVLFYFFKGTTFMGWTTAVGLVAAFYIIFRAWFMWWNQVYIVTSDRLVSVEQKGLFTRSMSESNLENVLFINHEIKGLIRTIFNFGDVKVRASGVNEEELIFTNIFDPYEVQQVIVKTQKTKTGLGATNQEPEKPNSNPKNKFVIR